VVRTHSKRHLVLFGEYIPFRREIPALSALAPIDDFTPGDTDTIFELPNGAKFGVLICFEDTVPELSRRYVRKGADFLVNMTNDAWFGDSGQQRMHLQNSVFRSVENGRELVRATNTGESCRVTAPGVVGPCVEEGGRRVLVSGVVTAAVTAGRGFTLFTMFGDVFAFLCFLGILITAAVRVCWRRRTREPQ
jgi:apolipoprotein N-acyltransferase